MLPVLPVLPRVWRGGSDNDILFVVEIWLVRIFDIEERK